MCLNKIEYMCYTVEEIDPVFNAIRYASTLSSHNRTESISSNGSVGSSSHHNNPSNPHLPLSPHSSSHHTHKSVTPHTIVYSYTTHNIKPANSNRIRNDNIEKFNSLSRREPISLNEDTTHPPRMHNCTFFKSRDSMRRL